MIVQLHTLTDEELESLKRLVSTPEYAVLSKVFGLLKADRTAEMIDMVPESSIDYAFNSGRVRGSILLMESFNGIGTDAEALLQMRKLKKQDKENEV